MSAPKDKYEVLIAGEWMLAKRGVVQPSGWLHWEDSDGSVGLQRPGKWRVREPKRKTVRKEQG
jgi:hypothetical protein